MTTPARLLLARHGQAHCNVQGVVGGPRGCTGLTDLGHEEARRLAARLNQLNTHHPITALYTSPILRVAQTAAPIAEALGLPACPIPALQEPHPGSADGQRWTDAVDRFGKIPALHPDLPLAPGAETWDEHYERARSALAYLLHRHHGETIAVVAHGETITAAAHLFLDLPSSVRARALFAAHNASLTTWEQQPLSWTRPELGQRWALVGHNDTAHLAGPAA